MGVQLVHCADYLPVVEGGRSWLPDTRPDQKGLDDKNKKHMERERPCIKGTMMKIDH